MSTIAMELDRVGGIDRTRVFLPAGTREVVFDSKAVAGLHPAVPAITAAVYAAMILTFWVGLVGSIGLALPMVIVTLFLVAFFGGAALMARIRRHFLARHGIVEEEPGSFRRFLAGHFRTGSGAVSGLEALVLVITVPACLLIAAISFAIIYNVI